MGANSDFGTTTSRSILVFGSSTPVPSLSNGRGESFTAGRFAVSGISPTLPCAVSALTAFVRGAPSSPSPRGESFTTGRLAVSGISPTLLGAVSARTAFVRGAPSSSSPRGESFTAGRFAVSGTSPTFLGIVPVLIAAMEVCRRLCMLASLLLVS